MKVGSRMKNVENAQKCLKMVEIVVACCCFLLICVSTGLNGLWTFVSSRDLDTKRFTTLRGKVFRGIILTKATYRYTTKIVCNLRSVTIYKPVFGVRILENTSYNQLRGVYLDDLRPFC